MGIGLHRGPAQYVPPGGSIMNRPENMQNQLGMANQSYAQQQAAAYNHVLAQQSINAQMKPKKQFMIEGREMDLLEFVETLYPEDCPERTFLLLKLKGENNE